MYLIILAIGLVSQEDIASERVDYVKVNHFYGDDGRHVFDQILFYRWNSEAREIEQGYYYREGERFDLRTSLPPMFELVAWRLVKSPTQLPQRINGKYLVMWYDGDQLRKVRAGGYVETWTQVDHELKEREILPKEYRPDLRKLKAKKYVSTP